MKKLASLALLSYCVTVLAPAQESGWPREIETSQGTVTIYQPQIEDFTGDKLEARAAVSVTPKGGAPVFGAVWISARVETDRDTRTVSVRSIEVPQVKFAHASDEDQQKLAEFLKKEIATWNLTFSVDDLLTSLEAQGIQGTQGLRHDPPRILYSQEPAILVRIDGEPKLEKLEGTNLQRVINTPFALVQDKQGTYYLSGGGDLWYSSRQILEGWQVASSVPGEVAQLVPEDEEQPDDTTGLAPPKIIVSTEPAELIISDGAPDWTPIQGMSLLYLSNSDSNVFLDINSQEYYVLLSGRWFKGGSVDDEWQWQHVPNADLPKGFSDIQPESPNGEVLTHVSGTLQAREAVLDNTIPQTAAVKREDALA